MTIFLWFAIGLGAIWVLLWVGTKIPVKHRGLEPRKIRNLLHTLLLNGSDSSILVIRVRKDERFVQFRLRMPDGADPGLELGFPRAPWSDRLFDEVARLVDEYAVPYDRVPTGEGVVTEFLVADFGSDVEGAQRLTTALLTSVYGVAPERDCVATLEGDFSSRNFGVTASEQLARARQLMGHKPVPALDVASSPTEGHAPGEARLNTDEGWG
jgi:hypothetical protein